jgi:hypothetical protein
VRERPSHRLRESRRRRTSSVCTFTRRMTSRRSTRCSCAPRPSSSCRRCGLESHLESRPDAKARLGLEVSAGWASPFNRGLWGGRRSAALHRQPLATSLSTIVPRHLRPSPPSSLHLSLSLSDSLTQRSAATGDFFPWGLPEGDYSQKRLRRLQAQAFGGPFWDGHLMYGPQSSLGIARTPEQQFVDVLAARKTQAMRRAFPDASRLFRHRLQLQVRYREQQAR